MATAILLPPPQSRPVPVGARAGSYTPPVDWQSRRFRAFFPYTSWLVLSPLRSGMVAAIGAITFYGLENPTAALAIVTIWTGLLLIYFSRPFLSTFLFAPAAYLGIRQIMTFGLGLLFYALETPDAASPEMQGMQIDAIVAALSKTVGFLLVFRAYQCLYVPLENPTYERNVLRPLSTMCFLSMGYVLLTSTILLFARGGGDRAIKAATSVNEALGWWSYLQLFSGVGYMIWFLVPLAWRMSGTIGRGFIVLVGIVTIGSGTLAGGRGALLYPLLYMVAGFFTFSKKPRNLDVALIIFMIFMVPFVTFWGVFRGTATFRESRLTDLPSRISAIRESFREYQERKDNQALAKGEFGGHLLGNQDIAIYIRTPADIPHAGFSEIANPINAVIPTFIYRSKKQVADGNQILVAYTNSPKDSLGMSLSFSGDLYRRFGHVGVPIGHFLAAAGFAAVMNVLYRFYFRRNATWGLAVIVFMGTAPGFGFLDSTVNEYMINWLYYIPKHLVFISAVYLISPTFTPFQVQGAAAYLPKAAVGA